MDSLRVLVLGDTSGAITAWLRAQGETVLQTESKISREEVVVWNPQIIVSYGYRHILRKDLLDYPKLGCVNLHISYLPWNRGADPNIWSHLTDTPKGVTVHYMDEGIDTGDIISRRLVSFDPEDTLRTSYAKLQTEVQRLFQELWPAIRSGRCPREKQDRNAGSVHKIKDRVAFQELIKEKGWDTPLREILPIYSQR